MEKTIAENEHIQTDVHCESIFINVLIHFFFFFLSPDRDLQSSNVNGINATILSLFASRILCASVVHVRVCRSQPLLLFCFCALVSFIKHVSVYVLYVILTERIQIQSTVFMVC